jgi:hypothetical protein
MFKSLRIDDVVIQPWKATMTATLQSRESFDSLPYATSKTLDQRLRSHRIEYDRPSFFVPSATVIQHDLPHSSNPTVPSADFSFPTTGSCAINSLLGMSVCSASSPTSQECQRASLRRHEYLDVSAKFPTALAMGPAPTCANAGGD